VGVTNPPSAVLALFEETGAYLRGHFRLTSGLHSGEYLQCARVLRFPAYAERFGRDLAAHLPPSAGATPDLVISPAMGGLIIGHEVARALGTPFLFTERDPASGKMTLRRGFAVQPGQTAVIIEDVITTGGSTREVVDLIQAAGGRVLAAGSIIDRSGGQADVGVPRVALETLHPVTWKPENCPLCAQGIEIQKPGSRVVPAAR
jgi:orotate phosphoribosyltransferase